MKSCELETKFREKRDCKRILINIPIKFKLWNPLIWKKHYTGSIKNISVKGMMISTRTINFPMDSLLEIDIPFKKEVVFIPVKNSTIVWKRMVCDNFCDAIGVKLSDPSQDYLEIVESLKATLKISRHNPQYSAS